MSFVALQDVLRRDLHKRIDAGQLTGLELARRTGFTQAHISNFLNRKRGLKLGALDRMLKAVGLSLYDLLNPRELMRFAAVPPGSDEEYVDVPLVEAATAANSEVIVNQQVKELVKFRRAFLDRLRADPAMPQRKSWMRFVLIHADTEDGMSMWPRFNPGSVLLLDRHYTALRPYRKNDRNIYAVRKSEGCAVKYVEATGSSLILRPHNPEYPVEIQPVEKGQNLTDLLIGRVAHAAVEI